MRDRVAPRGALLGLGAVVIAAVAVALLLHPEPDDIELLFRGGGVAGPALFVVAYVVLTLVVFPAAPLTIASGALYGAFAGAALSVGAATLGATSAFLLARRATGGVTVSAGGDGRLAAIERRLSGRGLYALLGLRLVPVIPFNALNYAAAASTISTRDYVQATVIGIIPGALLYAAIGAGLSNPASTLFVGAVLVAAAVALLIRQRSRAAAEALETEAAADPAD